MRRCHITLGATTTAGGVVVSASSCATIDGVAIALEGDQIACKACRGAGRIVCVGPRIPETWNGRQVALEDDLCMCGCRPPPRLKPSQQHHFQMVAATAGAAADAGGARSAAAAPVFDEAVQARDAVSDQPVAGLPYRFELPDGTVLRGVTDADGRTVRVRTPDSVGLKLFWEESDEGDDAAR